MISPSWQFGHFVVGRGCVGGGMCRAWVCNRQSWVVARASPSINESVGVFKFERYIFIARHPYAYYATTITLPLSTTLRPSRLVG